MKHSEVKKSDCIFTEYNVKDILQVLENIFIGLEKIRNKLNELEEKIEKLG